jgi:hypothetical protein
MMKRLLTILCIPAVLLLLGSTEGWSLPPCKDNVITWFFGWSDCFGTQTFGPKSEWPGHKYVGEYRNGKRHGQGTYTWADGRVEKGKWRDGEFLGDR